MATDSIEAVGRAVIRCRQCERLRTYCAEVARVKVARFRDQKYWGKPVPGFGDPEARLLIVGLAPAAHGANRTGRLFTGDSSGDWLYEALHRYGFANQPTSVSIDDGLTLTDCWISATGRCAPPDNKPLPEELDRCRSFLEREIVLLDRVTVVVTLGRIAHEGFLRASRLWVGIPPSRRPPFGHGTMTVLESGVRLLSSFHPSRQNTNTGKLTRPMWHAIFAAARREIDARASNGRTTA